MIQNNNVTYQDGDHSYKVNGKEAISVTQLLKAVGIVEGFDNVPENVKRLVEAAGRKGNHYDKLATSAMIELNETNDESEWDLDEWQTKFIKTILGIGFRKPQSQLLLGIDTPLVVAGRPDIMEEIEIEQDGKDYVGLCGDLKTTYNIKIKDVTFQTNLYTYLRDPENHEKYLHFVVHFDEKSEKFTVIQLKTIPNKKIESIFIAYQLGEQYNEQFDEVVDPKLLDKIFDKYFEKVEEMTELENQISEFKNKLINSMSENFIEDGETEKYKIHLTNAFTRKTVGWAKILNERNVQKIKEANKMLKELGKEEIKLDTEAEVKKNATEDEKERYTSVANVGASVSIKLKEKEVIESK